MKPGLQEATHSRAGGQRRLSGLLFIHGAGDSAGIWEHELHCFVARGGAVAIDLPGHGGRFTEPPHKRHAQNAAEALDEIHARGWTRPVVVGHALGGAVALTLASAHPEAVGALVLVASGARPRMHPEPIQLASANARVALPGLLAGPRLPPELALSLAATPEQRECVAKFTGWTTPAAVLAGLLANDAFDVSERLGEIAAPTLVLAGEDDVLTPPAFQQVLVTRIPGARLGVIPAACHYPFIEQAEIFNRVLAGWLEMLPRRAQRRGPPATAWPVTAACAFRHCPRRVRLDCVPRNR